MINNAIYRTFQVFYRKPPRVRMLSSPVFH